MSFYPETGIHITDKSKVILKLSNYDNKKELEHVTYVGTWNLATNSDLFLWNLKLTNETLMKWSSLKLVLIP